MAQYNNIDKKTAKGLNLKQTVLIETITEGNKTSINIYLNNSKKRSEAFYGIFQAEGFKFSKKKDEVQKSYRILKLHKALDEIGSKGAKEGVRFLKSEEYAPDPEPKAKPESTETPAEEAAPEATDENVNEVGPSGE